jgi:hypothetical protein
VSAILANPDAWTIGDPIPSRSGFALPRWSDVVRT